MSATHPRIAPTLESSLSPEDAAWFAAIGWSDAAVPPIESPAQADAYLRRQRALNAALLAVTYAERANSLEGRMAAAIGARMADWAERHEEE